MSARIAIVALTVVGSFSEGVGILLVAGRYHEARQTLGAAWRRLRTHVRVQAEALQKFFPVRVYRPRGLPVSEHVTIGGAVSMSGSLTAKVTASGSVEVDGLATQVKRLETQVREHRTLIDDLRSQFTAFEARIPADIAEGVKDPWHGIVLLAVGLTCLAAAGIIGAFSERAVERLRV